MLKGKRMEIEEYIDFNIDGLFGPLPEVIKYLTSIYEKHPKAILEYTGYDWDCHNIVVIRPETDEEHEERIRWEAEKKAREAYEAEIKRKALERRYNEELKKLNEKFGK